MSLLICPEPLPDVLLHLLCEVRPLLLPDLLLQDNEALLLEVVFELDVLHRMFCIIGSSDVFV